MTHSVRTVPIADGEIEEIDRWWREQRRAAPDLFLDELAAAFELLAGAPYIGLAYPNPDVEGVRRILLRASYNHVYHLVTDDEVVVISVWGAVKETGPNLRGRIP